MGDYLRGDTDEIPDVEVLVEIEKGARGWLQAISRSISSLSPKKRRGQRTSESASPKKSCGDNSSMAWRSPEKDPPSHVVEAASPSKWRGFLNITSRTSPSKNASGRQMQG